MSGVLSADKRSSSLCMRSMTSVGRDEEVRPTLTSQPNIAAYGALLIPEWRLEFIWNCTNLCLPSMQQAYP